MILTTLEWLNLVLYLLITCIRKWHIVVLSRADFVVTSDDPGTSSNQSFPCWTRCLEQKGLLVETFKVSCQCLYQFLWSTLALLSLPQWLLCGRAQQFQSFRSPPTVLFLKKQQSVLCNVQNDLSTLFHQNSDKWSSSEKVHSCCLLFPKFYRPKEILLTKEVQFDIVAFFMLILLQTFQVWGEECWQCFQGNLVSTLTLVAGFVKISFCCLCCPDFATCFTSINWWIFCNTLMLIAVLNWDRTKIQHFECFHHNKAMKNSYSFFIFHIVALQLHLFMAPHFLLFDIFLPKPANHCFLFESTQSETIHTWNLSMSVSPCSLNRSREFSWRHHSWNWTMCLFFTEIWSPIRRPLENLVNIAKFQNSCCWFNFKEICTDDQNFTAIHHSHNHSQTSFQKLFHHFKTRLNQWKKLLFCVILKHNTQANVSFFGKNSPALHQNLKKKQNFRKTYTQSCGSIELCQTSIALSHASPSNVPHG